MNHLAASELILNNDGSIYHLNLRPEHIAETILLVGDQNRVEKITQYFDEVEVVIQKREFHTQTGTYRGKRISVISTGIGTDNIDIVLNELDALVNIDFGSREIKKQNTSLNIIRIGTSGSIQKEIPVDSIVISELAVGFDSLLHFYQSDEVQLQDFNEALEQHLNTYSRNSKPYVVAADASLVEKFNSPEVYLGFTGSNVGFYAPQGRVLRLPLRDDNMKDKLAQFSFKGKKITNLEMETSAIFGLSKMLGHKALSVNAIIANRATGNFTKDGAQAVDNAIRYTLEKLIS
ncbi:MAG: nucleoside phosphorylase [Salinimicrobium sediminis]|uniref:Uridine phosphorylase n=1 Tax=Salinimicrobium sediminis TaxID=1343891 RepID=A0A285X4N2_9FLAO|nr:nucleoside phosphorylase [Salinimicrobium sediminis]MDX1602851.1 nucleoside phosphorylase [Salinimicrobium sediminis]SOC80272.1 uridine phosphorylase [Salinimicrobium sediminis]